MPKHAGTTDGASGSHCPSASARKTSGTMTNVAPFRPITPRCSTWPKATAIAMIDSDAVATVPPVSAAGGFSMPHATVVGAKVAAVMSRNTIRM